MYYLLILRSEPVFSIRDASCLLPTKVAMPRPRMRLMPDQDLFAFGNRGFPDGAEQHIKTLLESLLASKITEDEEKDAVESAIYQGCGRRQERTTAGGEWRRPR